MHIVDNNNLQNTIARLHQFIKPNKVVFLMCSSEIIDFTKPWGGNLVFFGKQGKFEFPFSNPARQKSILFALCDALKNKGLITWNIKNLFTYLEYHTKANESSYIPQCNIVDLKYSEAFLGIKNKSPKSLKEALDRCAVFTSNVYWKKISKHIYLPLALQTLPSIECHGVRDFSKRRPVYPQYEIEGQVNGRLRCQESFDDCINPHTLSPQQKKIILPLKEDEVFIELDYKHLEGSMIYWLTKDEVLRDLLLEGDLYSGVYEKLFKKKCQSIEKRKNIKTLFLSVMFGSHAAAIAKRYKMSLTAATYLYNEICKNFSTAMEWLDNKQNALVSNPIAKDYFGRQRNFVDKIHRRRNFEVQSPASVLCLEKLIQLQKELPNNIIFHIHDSYVLSSPIDIVRDVAKIAKRILQSPSNMCRGLPLKVSCKLGENLANMREI